MTFYRNHIAYLTRQLYADEQLTANIIAAKTFIDRHFANSINLDDVCAKACVSKFHFIRLFRKFYGRTPHQYLIEVRIDNARKLLDKNWSVTSVCYAVGFESPTSFSMLFKKITGLSPLTYLDRNSQKSNFQEVS